MSRDFSELVEKAVAISDHYKKLQKSNNQKEWTAYDRTAGLVGDVGDLCKLVQAKYNLRHGPDDVDKALAHELGDCLWSIIVISNMLNIDLEKSFFNSMENLQKRIELEKEHV
jgi:NTP pyrophosphatase (non-canonical NTP hydrolase)